MPCHTKAKLLGKVSVSGREHGRIGLDREALVDQCAIFNPLQHVEGKLPAIQVGPGYARPATSLSRSFASGLLVALR